MNYALNGRKERGVGDKNLFHNTGNQTVKPKFSRYSVFLSLSFACLLLILLTAFTHAYSITPAPAPKIIVDANINEWSVQESGVKGLLGDQIEIDLDDYEKVDIVGDRTSGLISTYSVSSSESPGGARRATNAISTHLTKASIQKPLRQVKRKGGDTGGNLATSELTSSNDILLRLSNLLDFWKPTQQALPEPTAMLLLGIGLLGLAAIGRRKIKSNGSRTTRRHP